MNIEIAGATLTFGTVSELNEILKRKCSILDKEIEEHEKKSSEKRKARKEMLKALGRQSEEAKSAVGTAA